MRRTTGASGRTSRSISVCAGSRSCPCRTRIPGSVHFDQCAIRSEPPQHGLSAGAGGPDVPGRCGYPGDGTTFGKIAQFAPRFGVVWTPNGDEQTSVRASWGVFYDTPHLFFNTRFANNPPWGAQITISNPPGGFADPYLGYPGGNPFPALNHRMGDAAASRVRRLREHAAPSRSRRACSSGTSACSGRSATGLRPRAIWATTPAICGAPPN